MPRVRVLLTLLALVCAATLPALATPGIGGAPEPLRVFQEPLASADYITFTPDPVTGTSQYLEGLAELERRYAEVIDVDDIGDLVGMPGIRSAGGREMPVITVTDESVPDENKIDLYFSMSIHGLERAGLEGGVRFIEDIAAGFYAERDGGDAYTLSNGDPEGPHYREMTATEVLGGARLVFVNLNPDGWAAGDTTRGGVSYKRGNDGGASGNSLLGGIDLNRQWPTLGWHNPNGERYETMSQPEAQAGRALIEDYLGIPEGAADLHGQFNDDVLLAIMFPAGQFDPRGLTQQVALAEAIKWNVNHSVFPGAAGLLAGREVQPAEYHTAYDAIGYDDSGFQGDYLVQLGILEMDHEYIFSNLVPNTVYSGALNQVHVDTTRELLKATIVTTLVAEEITYTADLGGTVAYVHNPEVLTEEGAQVPPPFGFAQEPYTSTSMRYYEDLSRYSTTPLVAIGSDEVAAGNLDAYDTVIVTDRALPRYVAADGSFVEPDRAAFWGALKEFAEAGGNLVLTDSALQGLADLGLAPANAVRRSTQDAGKVNNLDRSHPLLAGVQGVIGQTYFEVPLGYPFSNHAPAWSVDRSVWEAAGGTTAGTVSSRTALGTMPFGEGRITIFGAVLPDASQDHPHTHGLADYAVTYAGNAILVNALTWTR